jgi:hypothetical protein
MRDQTILNLPPSTLAILVIVSAGLPALLQWSKGFLRAVAKDAIPGSKLAKIDQLLLRGWGPLVTHLVTHIAMVSGLLIPLVQDGRLSLFELLAVLGGSALTGQGMYAAQRPMNGRTDESS